MLRRQRWPARRSAPRLRDRGRAEERVAGALLVGLGEQRDDHVASGRSDQIGCARRPREGLAGQGEPGRQRQVAARDGREREDGERTVVARRDLSISARRRVARPAETSAVDGSTLARRRGTAPASLSSRSAGVHPSGARSRSNPAAGRLRHRRQRWRGCRCGCRAARTWSRALLSGGGEERQGGNDRGVLRVGEL